MTEDRITIQPQEVLDEAKEYYESVASFVGASVGNEGIIVTLTPERIREGLDIIKKQAAVIKFFQDELKNYVP
jgi:hypothetical protein